MLWMKFSTKCFELSELLHCTAPRSTIHFSTARAENAPWSGAIQCIVPLCEGLLMLSLWIETALFVVMVLQVITASERSLFFLPELWFPANKVGLTEHLPSLLVTTGGPGVPSHSWALMGSLEDAPWCPLSLLSNFGNGSVLWLRTFSSSVDSVY